MSGVLAERVLVSQLGARMHYAVPRLLHQSRNLEHFYTDICATKGWPRHLRALPRRRLPNSLLRLADRLASGVPSDKITCFNGFGLWFALRRARMSSPSDGTRIMMWGGRTLSRLVIETGFGEATAVYGFSGESEELLVEARRRGLHTAVEQIIAPRSLLDRLIGEEIERFPNWEAREAVDRFADTFAKRERAEWAHADVIVCGSEFVRDAVVGEGIDPGRCVVVPYGVDIGPDPLARGDRGGPLRVVTVGSVGLRKGTPYVVEAARRLAGTAEFRLVGPCGLGEGIRREIAEATDLVGPAPRSDVAMHLAWADVFLLPSICEGSATAIYEALAAGLPVVTTPNAGSVVRDGVDGYVVPIRDGEAIADAIARLAGNPALRAEMGRNARARAAEFDLDNYGRRLRSALAAAWGDRRRPPDEGGRR